MIKIIGAENRNGVDNYKFSRKVYLVSGGVTKFAKAHPEMDFRYMVKVAYDYAMNDIPSLEKKDIDGSRISYFSDHFARQLKAASMVQDYLGLNPKGSMRIEWGGATGGEVFQAGFEAVASGRMDVCMVAGFETMSRVQTWKGNEFIALASDVNYDFPIGGFYSGYYALMVTRHIYEFMRRGRFANVRDEKEAQKLAIREASRILAMVSVKNHLNAMHNPYAQYPKKLSVQDVLNSEMISYPLTREMICTMSDGAAVAILANEQEAFRLSDHPVLVKGVGCGTDTMRLADRPFGKVPVMKHESESSYETLQYPGVHSFRAGRAASIEAYNSAGIDNPLDQLDFIELHDAYASSEIQTYEDMGLCRYGEGYDFVESGKPFLSDMDYGFPVPEAGRIPVNPSGGLIACGHPVGATGLMQAVFALWQLQGTIGKHFGNSRLQLKNPKMGAIHSHAGTGSSVTVSILEAVK
ncbi:MAG: thiolase domain-containing protein [Candidatus Thermoplasmatota archaeon]|nr:thiolase domain-containing protein [Candidatus Thermoplasmatota archaeon]MCL5254414.1 thiolase domain-containing protein [Candidatus Thermoplasmatota archaeon]